jgi:hypothetical protein
MIRSGPTIRCRTATSSTTQFLPGVARGHTAAGSSLMGLGNEGAICGRPAHDHWMTRLAPDSIQPLFAWDDCTFSSGRRCAFFLKAGERALSRVANPRQRIPIDQAARHAGRCAADESDELAPSIKKTRSQAGLALTEGWRVGWPTRDFSDAPSDKNLSKNGSVPLKGVIYLH